jgi:hypothetical protein
MSTYISKEEKLKYPYYKLIELKDEAIEIITRQITEA